MLDQLLTLLQKIDIASLVLGGVIGAFLGTWLNFRVTQPKLKVTGGGQGGYVHLSITNPHALLGFAIRPTMIWGKWLNHGSEFGQLIDRSPARDCSAVVFDADTGRHVGSAFWFHEGEFGLVTTIGPSETAQLILFTQQGAPQGTYYLWYPGGGDNRHVCPGPRDGQDALFDEGRDFFVEVRLRNGRRNFRFPFSVIKNFNGRFEYRSPTGGGTMF